MYKCQFCSKRFFSVSNRYNHEALNHVHLPNPQVQYLIKTKQIQLAPPTPSHKYLKYNVSRNDSGLVPLLKGTAAAYDNEAFDQHGSGRSKKDLRLKLVEKKLAAKKRCSKHKRIRNKYQVYA